MLPRNWIRISVLVCTVMMLNFCSENPLAPEDQEIMTLTKGIPADQITWVSWNPEVTAELEAAADDELARRRWGFVSRRIRRQVGGNVGGILTFDNRVGVPPFAFPEHRLTISVHVLHYNWYGQTAAGVDFLPTRQYDADMHITLSWGFLDVEGDEWESLDLQPYFSEDGGETWYPVEDYEVDPVAQTIEFDIDHFTQYAWGLDEDD